MLVSGLLELSYMKRVVPLSLAKGRECIQTNQSSMCQCVRTMGRTLPHLGNFTCEWLHKMKVCIFLGATGYPISKEFFLLYWILNVFGCGKAGRLKSVTKKSLPNTFFWRAMLKETMISQEIGSCIREPETWVLDFPLLLNGQLFLLHLLWLQGSLKNKVNAVESGDAS